MRLELTVPRREHEAGRHMRRRGACTPRCVHLECYGRGGCGLAGRSRLACGRTSGAWCYGLVLLAQEVVFLPGYWPTLQLVKLILNNTPFLHLPLGRNRRRGLS